MPALPAIYLLIKLSASACIRHRALFCHGFRNYHCMENWMGKMQEQSRQRWQPCLWPEQKQMVLWNWIILFRVWIYHRTEMFSCHLVDVCLCLCAFEMHTFINFIVIFRNSCDAYSSTTCKSPSQLCFMESVNVENSTKILSCIAYKWIQNRNQN